MTFPTVLGMVESMPSPGYASFSIEGVPGGAQPLRLDAVLEPGETQLFFIFRDATSGKTTYGGGRFLYADPPAEGKVVLDFNRAYSPPCAFTPHATCPLPPAEQPAAGRRSKRARSSPGTEPAHLAPALRQRLQAQVAAAGEVVVADRERDQVHQPPLHRDRRQRDRLAHDHARGGAEIAGQHQRGAGRGQVRRAEPLGDVDVVAARLRQRAPRRRRSP